MFSSSVIQCVIIDSRASAYPGSSCSACDHQWSSVALSRWHGRPPGPPAHHGHATPWHTPETGRGYRGGSSGTDPSGGVCPVPGTQPCLGRGREIQDEERKDRWARFQVVDLFELKWKWNACRVWCLHNFSWGWITSSEFCWQEAGSADQVSCQFPFLI